MGNVIATATNTQTSNTREYTATQDCWAYYNGYKSTITCDASILVNDKVINTQYLSSAYQAICSFVPLKKGDTIRFNDETFYKSYSIYGLRF